MAQRGRPKTYSEDRKVKAVRISEELDRDLKAVSAERGVSVNLLINRAIADYLARLTPVDELLPVADG
ncbi:MAG: CopG family transcriptional regulator [Actinomycetota bacterium]